MLPSPTAPSWGLPVFGSCRRLHPEGRALALHDPCAPAQASRRSRSAARSPGLFPRISAPGRPCGLHSLPSGSAVASRIIGSGPKTFALSPFRFGGPGPRLRLYATTFLRKHPAQASVQSWTRLPHPVLASQFQLRSATYRPFAALLGMIGPSRCPDCPLRDGPACGGETITSSGASCRLRFEDPSTAPSGHPGEAQSSRTNSTSSPCRRRSEVPFLSCRHTLAGPSEERAGCPPITIER